MTQKEIRNYTLIFSNWPFSRERGRCSFLGGEMIDHHSLAFARRYDDRLDIVHVSFHSSRSGVRPAAGPPAASA